MMKTAVDWVHNEGKIQDSGSEKGIQDLLEWLEAQVKKAQVSAAPQPAPAPVPASSTSAATVTFTGTDIMANHKEKKRKKTAVDAPFLGFFYCRLECCLVEQLRQRIIFESIQHL